MTLCIWKIASLKRHRKLFRSKVSIVIRNSLTDLSFLQREKLQLKNKKRGMIALIFTAPRRSVRASSGKAICKQLIAVLKKCPSTPACSSIESSSAASTDEMRTLQSSEVALSKQANLISMPISRQTLSNRTWETGQAAIIMQVICGKVQRSRSPRCFPLALTQRPKEDNMLRAIVLLAATRMILQWKKSTASHKIVFAQSPNLKE